MTEYVQLAPSLIAGTNTRRWTISISLIFTWSLIVYLVVSGSPTNSLHESALAWAFMTNIAVLFAYSFGTVVTNFFKK